jgi:exoribonuclease-2
LKHLLFEENGDFKAASVMSDAGATLQVEMPSGKRVKIKAAHVLLRFDAPQPENLISQAQRIAEDIDVDLAWECAPQDEFSFIDFAAEYFGGNPSTEQTTALLLRLQASPIHFQRKGRGRFRPAPAQTVQAALAAVERKRQQELRVQTLTDELLAGQLPDVIAEQAGALLYKPDKTSIEFRALDRAAQAAGIPAEELLIDRGAFPNPKALHLARFAAEHFPQGTGFSSRLQDSSLAHARIDDWPLSEAAAFSIDDASTTEIDDALSVSRIAQGGWRVGVHIAAPALGIGHETNLDLVARDRMSSVYMPGEKITMLPHSAVGLWSLDAPRTVAAVSLYVDIDETASRIVATHSAVERVRIAANLRHEHCEHITEADLDSPERFSQWPFGSELSVLWRFTLALSAERERVRGKPEPRFRTDFSFHIESQGGVEHVRIVQRRRDAPRDRIVAEMMILANSRWGGLLADHEIPGIYRSQQAGRVRMSSHPLAHEGLGVPQYIWSTSPLRRYVDLVNQRQLVALLTGERAPFGPRDAALFSVISGFEAKHSAYADFQNRMERFWCLRWVQQQGLSRAQAVVVREDLVRLADAPLYFRLAAMPALAGGRRIEVELAGIDLISLSLDARFVALAESSSVSDEIDALADIEDDETSAAAAQTDATIVSVGANSAQTDAAMVPAGANPAQNDTTIMPAGSAPARVASPSD